MKSPFFSIITPTYNREDSIDKCISSVLEQSFKDFELLIIDNNSIDKTIESIIKFKDERIRLFINENNFERCYSRNKGIKIASGKFILFLDSDDQLLPNHLQNWYYFLNNYFTENTFFISNKTIKFDNKLFEIPHFINYEIKNNLLKFPVIPGQVCIPLKIAKKFEFETDYLIFEDTALWLKIAVNYKIASCKITSYIYNINENNSVNVKRNNFGERRLISLKNFIIQNPSIIKEYGKELFKTEVSTSLFTIAKYYMANDERISAIFYIIKSIIKDPRSKKLKHQFLLILFLLLNREIKEYGFKSK